MNLDDLEVKNVFNQLSNSIIKNSMKFNPPIELAYWSCLPMGSPNISISISQASLAISDLLRFLPENFDAMCMSPTVNALDDPRPVPAGISELTPISIELILKNDKIYILSTLTQPILK